MANTTIIKILFFVRIESQAIPNDPDGLHRLGLALYSQGKRLRDASGTDDVIAGKNTAAHVAVLGKFPTER